MVERTGVHRILVGRPEGRNQLEDPNINGILVSKWIFKRWEEGA